VGACQATGNLKMLDTNGWRSIAARETRLDLFYQGIRDARAMVIEGNRRGSVVAAQTLRLYPDIPGSGLKWQMVMALTLTGTGTLEDESLSFRACRPRS